MPLTLKQWRSHAGVGGGVFKHPHLKKVDPHNLSRSEVFFRSGGGSTPSWPHLVVFGSAHNRFKSFCGHDTALLVLPIWKPVGLMRLLLIIIFSLTDARGLTLYCLQHYPSVNLTPSMKLVLSTGSYVYGKCRSILLGLAT